MKPTILSKEKEEEEPLKIEKEAKSKLVVFTEILSFDETDKIDQIIQTKPINLRVQKTKFSILKEESLEKPREKSSFVKEKTKSEDKEKDILEKPSRSSRSYSKSDRKKKEKKPERSDSYISGSSRQISLDKRALFLTPSLGEVDFEILSTIDKEKQIRSSLNEMVQTGSDLGEPISSDNESEHKGYDKEKDKNY